MFKHGLTFAESRDQDFRPHNELAFTNYLRWFIQSTRVSMCPPAFQPDILEQPTDYYALARENYNKAVREGTQTAYAPVLTFVVSTIGGPLVLLSLFACLTCEFLFMLSGMRCRNKLMSLKNFWILTRLLRR